MRAAFFLLSVPMLLVAGCAQPGEMEAVALQHDYEDSPKARTFDVPDGVETLILHLEIHGKVDALRCEVEDPARISVLDPSSREVVLVTVDGAELPTGGQACTATNAQQRFDARPGVWTVFFAGSGTLTGAVDARAAE